MRRIGWAVVLVIVAGACSSSTHHSSALTPTSNTSVPTRTTSTSLPIGYLTVQEQARRDHPTTPPAFPNVTHGIDPNHIVHHSGGPYLTARQAADVALTTLRCTLGGAVHGDPASQCERADVCFFDRYATFWAVEGGQAHFVATWGPDREMYVVTVFGKLPFAASTESSAPSYVGWQTYQLDATTGHVLRPGGLPLPEHFRGVVSFAATTRPKF